MITRTGDRDSEPSRSTHEHEESADHASRIGRMTRLD